MFVYEKLSCKVEKYPFWETRQWI